MQILLYMLVDLRFSAASSAAYTKAPAALEEPTEAAASATDAPDPVHTLLPLSHGALYTPTYTSCTVLYYHYT